MRRHQYSYLITHKLGKRKWELLEDYVTPHGVTVPAGFKSNGASVPRIFWWFLDPATEAFEAAIVHDYLLYMQEKKRADATFKKVLEDHGVNWFKTTVAHLVVKLFSSNTKLPA